MTGNTSKYEEKHVCALAWHVKIEWAVREWGSLRQLRNLCSVRALLDIKITNVIPLT